MGKIVVNEVKVPRPPELGNKKTTEMCQFSAICCGQVIPRIPEDERPDVNFVKHSMSWHVFTMPIYFQGRRLCRNTETFLGGEIL